MGGRTKQVEQSAEIRPIVERKPAGLGRIRARDREFGCGPDALRGSSRPAESSSYSVRLDVENDFRPAAPTVDRAIEGEKLGKEDALQREAAGFLQPLILGERHTDL